MNKGFVRETIVVSMRYVLACQWSSDVKKSDHVGISAVRHCLSELPEHVGRLPWIADVEQMQKLEEGHRYAGDMHDSGIGGGCTDMEIYTCTLVISAWHI